MDRLCLLQPDPPSSLLVLVWAALRRLGRRLGWAGFVRRKEGFALTADFSRRTWLAAIDVIEEARYFPQAKLTGFIISLGTEVRHAVRSETVSAERRLNDLKEFIDDNAGYLTDDGPIERVVIEKAISFIPISRPDTGWLEPPPPTAVQSRLIHLLDQDGFAFQMGALVPQLPADLGLAEAQSDLYRLLDKYDLRTPKGHLEQALENHARGRWSSANGELRKFLEGLLDEIAVRIDQAAAGIKPGHDRRTHLSLGSPAFLSTDLGEWSADGKNFLNGLMKRLHPAGGHPGLSDEDDSTFRLHVVLLTARLFLVRFDRGPR